MRDGEWKRLRQEVAEEKRRREEEEEEEERRENPVQVAADESAED